MPIVIRKHFGDSDDDNDNSNTIDSFLAETDNSNPIQHPPLKKRKLNTHNSDNTQSIQSNSKKTSNNNKKKTKSMLKRLRIKKKKQKNKTNKNNNKPKNTHRIQTISFESIKPIQIAKEFQKLILKTFKTTSKELQFEFKPSHFIEINRDIDPINNNINSGSLDILNLFLRNYYCNIIIDDKQNINNTKTKSKKEWVAYTKSMQIMIISPSVRKAVDTIQSLRDINVQHSYIYGKHLLKMDEEEYEEYEKTKDEQMSDIGLRICELFGKHRKIEWQQDDLLNRSWHCGVGGINRINKLCKSKHLTLKKCELVVIDMQTNAKNMNIIDMKEMCKELCLWLKEYVFKGIKDKQTKIAFF